MHKIFSFGLLALLAASPASAALQSVTPTKSNGDFLPGTGIPEDNFTVASGGGVTIALKARGRDSGQPLSINGNTYNVSPGLAANNVNPWWNFDFQFTPDDNAPAANQITLTLQVDFDPALGTEDFRTYSGLVSSLQWQGSLMTNPKNNTWSENDTDYVIANSWRYDFAFWSNLAPGTPTGYNPFSTGEYKIILTATADNAVLASSEILVNVGPVPEPGSIVLILGLAACGIPATLRRRWTNAR